MVGSVNYGSGKRAYDPLQTVAGKTGTCKEDGNWVGLFASYAPLVNPKLAVVVIARRTDGRGHFPAAVAGQIYRDLNRRFGTPTFIPIADSNNAAENDEKAKLLNEENQEQKKADADDAKAVENVFNDELMKEDPKDDEATATSTKGESAPGTKPANSKVKQVMMQVPKQTTPTKTATEPKDSKKTPAPDNRPRRVNGEQP
jgi:hypothetical protein